MTSIVFVENGAELVEALVRVTASQGRALELSGSWTTYDLTNDRHKHMFYGGDDSCMLIDGHFNPIWDNLSLLNSINYKSCISQKNFL